MLDGTWVLTFAIAAPAHLLAAAIGAAVLGLGALAIRVRKLGHLLLAVRGLAAFALLISAAHASALLVLAAAAGCSGFLGFAAAYGTEARPRPAHAASRRRPKRTRSTRYDEVGSAVLHFGVLGLLLGGTLFDGQVTTALGFALFYVGVTWGTIAVHECGHAFAAAQTGNTVTHVRIGMGFTMFRSERITVGAIPVSGLARWAPNVTTMTNGRRVAIALAGPAANLLVASVLVAVPAVRHSGFGFILIGAHAFMGLTNLVPVEHEVGGRRMSNDGARALRLLRPSRVRPA